MSMSKEAVQDRMKDKNTVLLNVLPGHEFAKLHIKGSENLTIGINPGDFVESVEKMYGKDKFFITYCAGANCDAGSNAAKALREKGFKADDYYGGMQNWMESGFPVEGTDPAIAVAGSSESH